MWKKKWNPSQVNKNSFGIYLTARYYGSSVGWGIGMIDAVKMTIHHSEIPATFGTTGIPETHSSTHQGLCGTFFLCEERTQRINSILHQGIVTVVLFARMVRVLEKGVEAIWWLFLQS